MNRRAFFRACGVLVAAPVAALTAKFEPTPPRVRCIQWMSVRHDYATGVGAIIEHYRDGSQKTVIVRQGSNGAWYSVNG